MKKTFRNVIVALSVLCMGGVMTSCELDSSWLSGITEILGGIIGLTGNSSSYTYAGTAKFDMYDYDEEKNEYNGDSKVSTSAQITATVEYYLNEEEPAAVIALSDFSFTSGSTRTTISNFTFTTYCNESKIDPNGPSYLTGATCTIDGKQVEVPCACIEGSYTENSLKLTNIYFQVGDKVYMGTFTGTLATAE